MPAESPITKNVVRLLLVIVVGFALVAVYANVQKIRRAKIEAVKFVPASAQATPAASP